MATFLEIRGLFSDDGLRGRAEVAIVIAAQAKLSAVTPLAADVAWAGSVINSPAAAGQRALRLVLAANSGASVAAITSASDAAIQANIDEFVPGLIMAHGV